MDQPITPTPPVFTPTPAKPESTKKSYIWLIVAVIAFLLAASSVLAYKNFKLKKQAVQTQPSPTPTPTALPTEISSEVGNWKTYTDTQYAYEIKYPIEWIIDNDINNPTIVTIQSEQGSVIIDPTNRTKITEPIKDWVEKSNKQLLNDPNRHSASSPMQIIPYDNELKINEIPTAINGEFWGRQGKDFIFSHKNTIFYITAFYYDGSYSTDSLTKEVVNKRAQLINQILSTFKFLGQNSPTSSCTPKFKVESGPELTASEAYSQKCYEAKTREECEKVDIYRESTQNFGNSDGIPDCSWTESK